METKTDLWTTEDWRYALAVAVKGNGKMIDTRRQYIVWLFETLITRAEAAEAERDALREREADLLRTLHVEQDAHDRLREQLAAREWRPVDEPPTETGDYLIGCDYAEDIRVAEYHAATELYFQLMDDGEWQQANWHTHWQPLPTPPQDDDR